MKFINIYLGTLPRQISSVLDTTLEVNLIVGFFKQKYWHLLTIESFLNKIKWLNLASCLRVYCWNDLAKNPRYQKSGISPSYHVFVTCFEKFPRNFSRTSSCEWFPRNSRVIPRNYRDILGFIVLRNSWVFLLNFSQEIIENFSRIFLWKFLRNSQDLVTNFFEFLGPK